MPVFLLPQTQVCRLQRYGLVRQGGKHMPVGTFAGEGEPLVPLHPGGGHRGACRFRRRQAEGCALALLPGRVVLQQDSRKLSHKRFYRPAFRAHLTNQEILHQLLSYSDQLRQHYELYQLLLFHFQEKQTNHFFDLIEENLSAVHPIFQTVCRTFLKDRDKITNALELPYSNAKLEALTISSRSLSATLLDSGTLTTLRNAFSSL